MSAINPTSTSFSNVMTNSTSTTAAPVKTLGQDDFLKLLATQFQQQDPMKPMDDTQFIAQMAQFSSLEQTNNLVSQVKTLNSGQTLLSANNYIGRNVTVNDANGNPVTGMVTAVNNDPDTGVSLLVNGTSYDLSSLRRIEAAPLPTASTNVTTTP